MRQAFHIFRKDVRYLRYDIGLTLFIAAAFCFLAIHRVQGPGPLTYILPVSWWFLIARVIHAEALPGNRQFWLTRPYRWKSLLGSKVLFILVFVNLPLLFADCVIIHAAGFSIAQNLAGLLWTQVLLIAAFVLPAAALSAITNGLAELLIVTLTSGVTAFAFLFLLQRAHRGSYWMELEWVKTYLLLVSVTLIAVIVLLWQYARRSTFATRTAAVLAVMALIIGAAFLPWRVAFALQSHFPKPDMRPSIQVRLDKSREWLGRIYPSGQDQITAELPLEISSVPKGTIVEPNGLTVAVQSAGRGTWVVRESAPENFNFESGITSIRAEMPEPFYLKVRDRPVRLRGTLYFTVYGRKQNTLIPLDGTTVNANGIGLCSAGRRYFLCNSAFRTPRNSALIRIVQQVSNGENTATERVPRIGSYSPFPAALTIDPIHRFRSLRLNPMSAASIEIWQPLAHLEKHFAIDGVRLDALAGNSALNSVVARSR